MRKIAANYIFPVSQKPLKNGIIEIDNNGYITNIIDTEGDLREAENIEFYNGILIPGFVNTHCHLELSHIKNKVPKHSGLPDFIINILKFRDTDKNEIIKNIVKADKEMQRNGIVAVGDISNTDNSFQTKSESKIKYHTFIEIYDINNNIKETIDDALNLSNVASAYKLKSSIVPHAPYSVSTNLYNEITYKLSKDDSIISTHNQESEEENKLYINKSGKLNDYKIIPVDFTPTGYSSLISTIKHLATKNNVLLVHNTYTSEGDILVARNYLPNLFWVICPNANLFIENRIPNLDIFIKNNQTITIGTDSFASNEHLSILKEIITISQHYPKIPLETLISWATINGAKALHYDDLLGSFEIGKKPGVVLLDNINFREMKITDNTTVKVLV